MKTTFFLVTLLLLFLVTLGTASNEETYDDKITIRSSGACTTMHRPFYITTSIDYMTFYFDIEIDRCDYEYYIDADHTPNWYQADVSSCSDTSYSYYLKPFTTPEDTVIQDLADSIKDVFPDDPYRQIDLAMKFTQDITARFYEHDPSDIGSDYPKYPLETIGDNSGDCEDGTILLSSLLSAMGYESMLMIVGVMSGDTCPPTWHIDHAYPAVYYPGTQYRTYTDERADWVGLSVTGYQSLGSIWENDYGKYIPEFLEAYSESVTPDTYYCNSCSDCQTKINSASAGEIVRLTADISNSDTCIDWTSNDITFDCQGYSIDTLNTESYGVHINSDGNKVMNCVMTNNVIGIKLLDSNNCQINDNTIINSSIPISMSGSSNNQIIGNTINYSEGFSSPYYGIMIYSGSDSNQITDNLIYTTYRGLGISGTGTSIYNNTACGATYDIYNTDGTIGSGNTCDTTYNWDCDYPCTAPATVTRTLPDSVNAGSTFDTTLDVVIVPGAITGLIIHEFVPLGWTVISSSPTYNSFNSETGKVTWVLYSGTLISQTITYTVSVSAAESASYKNFTSEVWYVYNGDQMDEILGDSTIEVIVSEPEINATRTLPEAATNPGKTITVNLEFILNAPITGIIISEHVPTGWNVTDTAPTASFYNGEVKWILYGSSLISQNLSYEVEVPTDESVGEYSFSGEMSYVYSGDQTDTILGDTTLNVESSGADILMNRSIAEPVDDTVSVSLDLYIMGDVGGVIIKEYIPAGLSVTSSNPTYDSFNSETGEIRWILYGSTFYNRTLTYSLQIPQDTIGTFDFVGYCLYNDAGGTSVTDEIGGDTNVSIALIHILTVDRSLPSSATKGGEISVSLDLDVNESVSSVIIKEYIPLGWTMASSSPSYDSFTSDTGEIRWFLYGANYYDRTLTYTAQIPSNDTGSKTFSGEFLYMYQSNEITDVIGGDTEVTISSIPGDTNGDGQVSDFELLAFVELWVTGEVGDFELLEAVGYWSEG